MCPLCRQQTCPEYSKRAGERVAYGLLALLLQVLAVPAPWYAPSNKCRLGGENRGVVAGLLLLG
jgi:hypothetical protein